MMKKILLSLFMAGTAVASCQKGYDCNHPIMGTKGHVVYSDSEWWGVEKWPSANYRASQILPRRFDAGDTWSMARSPQDLGVLFHLEDCFPQGHQIYAHTARVEDDLGNPHIFRLEWAGYWETQNRTLGIFKRRQYVHSVRALLNGRVIFTIDDCVEDGLYEYEDFFRVGNRSFRVVVRMDSRPKDYGFEAMLLAYRPAASEAQWQAARPPRAEMGATKKAPKKKSEPKKGK